ncbi:hypothetical protein [Prosthecobacter sp.]|uniref:hypothetical protein n=1 Tax=Prosthecobacter sp. TaxID=1965333 RepID=UPI0037837B2F
MLIWKGHGILILVFGVAGAVATAVLTGMLFAATQSALLGRLAMCAPFWGAAAAIWLYAKTMGKPTERTLLDPATHRPVVITSSHSFFFIPPVPWAVLATVLACLVSVFAVIVPASTFDYKGMANEAISSAGGSEFEKANKLISMDKGQEAFGNTPEAQQMAAEFAQMVKLGRRLGIQAGKKPTISLSHGKFLTYCQINPDSCAFMVHVPDLRKFSKDAKEYIADVAWSVAMDSALELKPRPKRLAVGIRGAFLYDTVIEGHVVPEEEDADAGIEKRHSGNSSQNALGAYFVIAKTPLADLPKRGTAEDAPEKKTAGTTAPKAPASDMADGSPIQEGMNAQEKLEALLKWFPTTKAGGAGGNGKAQTQIARKYAEYVEKRVSANPALGGMSLPDPAFAAYLHVRDDTMLFFLALSPGAELTPEAVALFENEAWNGAAATAVWMSPLPVHVAVVTFNEAKMSRTRVGSPQNQEGTDWLVEKDFLSEQGREVLTPYLEASSKPLMKMDASKKVTGLVKSAIPPAASDLKAKASPSTPAPSPAPPAAPPPAAAPAVAAAPASPPLLPTPVRDWKDSTGRIMQASLERFTSPAKDTGYFKRADGQGFEVPFSRLSAEDQAMIRDIAQKFQ